MGQIRIEGNPLHLIKGVYENSQPTLLVTVRPNTFPSEKEQDRELT